MLYHAILGCAFLSVLLLVIGLYQLFFASRHTVLERLRAHTTDVLPQQEETARGKGLQKEILAFLGMLGSMLPRRAGMQDLQKKLVQAHFLMRAEEFIGFKIICTVLLFALVYILSGSALLAVPFLLIGYKIPDLLVDTKKKKRMNALTEQLPEALGIISSGLRAGFSFPQAMSVVSKEMNPPIRDEFSRVIWENRMGKPLEEALHNLGERTDSDDLDLFITAIIIQKQVGGNLAEILDNISHTIRERVRIKGEIKTLTAQGKLSAAIIIMLPIFVASFLIFLNPEYMLPLIQTSIGLVMLILALILQVTGIFIIRKIVSIEV